MIGALLGVVVLVGVATLVVAIGVLRSSRRSEGFSKARYELLRDQRDQLDMLREERRMLTEELERDSGERRRLLEYLEETDPRLMENYRRGFRPQFPIEGYEELTVEELSARLGALSAEDLRKVRDYEERNNNRKTILEQLDRRIRSSS
jgi:hypothetical protein